MTTINEFYKELKGGYKPTQYRVNMVLPDFVTNASEANRKISFLCKAAQMPGVTIGSTEVHYRNKTLPFAGDTTFEPWEGTVYADGDFIIRNALEVYMNAINNFGKTGGQVDMNEITLPVQITAMDTNDTVLKTTTLENAWISTLGPLDLAYENKDQIGEYTLTIQFSHIS